MCMLHCAACWQASIVYIHLCGDLNPEISAPISHGLLVQSCQLAGRAVLQRAAVSKCLLAPMRSKQNMRSQMKTKMAQKIGKGACRQKDYHSIFKHLSSLITSGTTKH